MSWPTYTIADLAVMTGRPEASFTAYANMAIEQSLLLFKLATCLKDWPTDSSEAQLARYAILTMADAFSLAQPNAIALSSPFQSESIGSYSYSKAMKAIQAGTPTGVSWFDMAIQQLGICETGGLGAGIASGSVTVFEKDGFFTTDSDGHKTLLGPCDIEPLNVPPTYISGQDPGAVL